DITSTWTRALTTFQNLPSGISVKAKFRVVITGGAPSVGVLMWDAESIMTGGPYAALRYSSGSSIDQTMIEAISNTSRQVILDASLTGTSPRLRIWADGWEDYTIPRIGG